jgi:murein L,D-transpeptidase YcbB/YkuD
MIGLEQKAKEVYGGFGSIAKKVDLEFKITGLYREYADYTIYGAINWRDFKSKLYKLKAKKINASWVTHTPKTDIFLLIEDAVLNGSLENAFTKVTPKEYHYSALYQKLISYIKIKKSGGWRAIYLKGSLKVGKAYEVVPLLRKRLEIVGDYRRCGRGEEGLVYDSCLQEALINFQKRNGLVAKGIIDTDTIALLSRTVEERIATIRLNLDRIKWLKERCSKRHIIVNIPDFRLYFEEDGKQKLSMKVITGKRKHPTPIFSNAVRYIVLNPYWNIPKSIIQKEMIPKLLKNLNAMAKQDIEIRVGWKKNAPKVKASSINWKQYRYSKHMPFRFAQVPGKKNALGKVKYLFPNRYAVYMHDTPHKRLFTQNVRAFSHGCIRLSEPIALLRVFAGFNNNIDFEGAQNIMKGKKRKYLNLDTPVPIDVVYLTAWVDYDGVLQFRDDLYGYDKMQLTSIKK